MKRTHEILQAITMPRGTEPIKLKLLSIIAIDLDTNYRERLADTLKLSKTATLSHLTTLHKARLIKKHTEGKKTVYSITKTGKKILLDLNYWEGLA